MTADLAGFLLAQLDADAGSIAAEIDRLQVSR